MPSRPAPHSPGGLVAEQGTAVQLHLEGRAIRADSAEIVVRPPTTLLLSGMWPQFTFLRDCHIENLTHIKIGRQTFNIRKLVNLKNSFDAG